MNFFDFTDGDDWTDGIGEWRGLGYWEEESAEGFGDSFIRPEYGTTAALWLLIRLPVKTFLSLIVAPPVTGVGATEKPSKLLPPLKAGVGGDSSTLVPPE